MHPTVIYCLCSQAVHRSKSLVKKVSVDRTEAVSTPMTALVENALQYKDYVFPDVEMLDEGHRYMPDVEEDLVLIVKILDENIGSSYSDLSVASSFSEFAARPMPRGKTGSAKLMAGWDRFREYAHKAVGSSELDDEPELAEGEAVMLNSDSDDNDDDSDGADSGDDVPLGDTLIAARGKKWTVNNPPRRGESLEEKLTRCRTLMTRTAVRVQDNMREARRRQLYAAAQLADPTLDDLSSSDDSSSEEEWEVGSIRGKRCEGRRIEYLVRWKRFGADEDSWEPAYNLELAKAEIAKFEKVNK